MSTGQRIAIGATLALALAVCSMADDLRIGMIGLDTSHVVAFTKLLNVPDSDDHVPGGRVVAAYKGGSPDIEKSYSRVDGFTQQLRDELGVEIVDSIEDLCAQVDVVMLMSLDGRPHLDQIRPVLAAGKTCYIDKPVAGSLEDAIEIYRLAKTFKVPCFSASSYRFYDSFIDLKQQDVGEIRGAISWGPCKLEEHHPDLYWYGVHPVEALFAVLGTGCESVVRTATPDTDVATGVWSGGRVGTLRGLRNAAMPHKVVLFGTKGVALQEDGGDSYRPLVVEIMRFFQTGVSPVSPRETIEMFAFMEAADESKRRGGAPVAIAEVLEKALHGRALPYEPTEGE